MVQLDQRYNVDEALADPYFDITEGTIHKGHPQQGGRGLAP